MARAFRRKGATYEALLDRPERAIVAGLMEQTRSLLAPEVASTGDPLADLVADLESAFAGIESPEGPPRGTEAVLDGNRDPALARLLPDGHRGDPEVAAEFRRLTEQDLRRRKSDALTSAIDALRGVPEDSDRLVLDRAGADALLVALTDTRLLLAERLGVRDDEDVEAMEDAARRHPDEPLAYAVAVYDFLTWLQETLAGELLRSLDSGGQG